MLYGALAVLFVIATAYRAVTFSVVSAGAAAFQSGFSRPPASAQNGKATAAGLF
jgi:hypothetical protein